MDERSGDDTASGRTREMPTRVDRFIGRHPVPAVLVAVFKKYGDDGGGRWAALVSYYGFLSLFPLLLVFTTVLGFVVQGDEELQQRIVDSALSQFPIIGEQIRQNLGALDGSVVALAIGLVGAVWAGLAIALTLQDAMNDVWDVPRRSRPGFVARRIRALATLAGLGVVTLVSAGLTALGTIGGSLGWMRVLALAGTLGLNVVAFGAAFRYLTVAEIRWRDVLPGAASASVSWMVLLAAGSWLVDRQLRDASALYGFFAIVLGLLGWISLGAHSLLLSAELNTVLARRLWPRSLQPPPLSEPDRRMLAAGAEQEAARPTEESSPPERRGRRPPTWTASAASGT
jgi:YihY family inner membrane protein